MFAVETKKLSDAISAVKEMMGALNSQDYEKAVSFFTEDCIYDDVPTGRVYHGKKEVLGMVKGVHAMFPDHKWEWTSSFGDSDRIASETVWSGTFTNSGLPGISATGKRATFKCVSITEMGDGKIKRNSDYYDSLVMYRQLGIPIPQG